MKKILSVLVFFVCAISMSAQDDATIDGIIYYLENGKATVMQQPTTLSGDIVIPEKVSNNGNEYVVTKLSDGAFAYSNISRIKISNNVTFIGKCCFSECSSLTSITLSDSIISLGDNCFSDCTRLTSITLPNNVTYIGGGCFNCCIRLASITIPDGVTSLANNCFNFCRSLTSITLPNSVNSLGNCCFNYCNSLTSITLPNSVTSLGDYCFSKCSSLTSITLPNSVTSLGDNCFSDCSSLTSITLPNSVISLGDNCFSDCSSLTSITIPDGISSLGDKCFFECSRLASITLPNSVTSLGNYCLYACNALTSITLPNSITALGNYCLNSCSLTSITIPNSITSLGQSCFSYCSNLAKIICQWTNIDTLTVDTTAFNNIFSEAKLYIPSGTSAMYKAKKPWSNFKYIVEDGDGGTTPETPKQCAAPVITYADKKLNFASSTTGAQYHYTITDADVKSDAYSEDGNVTLAAAYSISAYASADGYTNSEKATATLYFINADLKDATGISSVSQRGIVVQSNNGFVTVSGLNDNEAVSIYSVSGAELGSMRAAGGTAAFSVNQADKFVIVKIGNDAIKVNL